jgi:hypothetical protein
MNVAERAERVLRDYMGLVPPWDRPYAKRAMVWALDNVWEIEAFKAQGMDLIADPARRELILKHVGPRPDDVPIEEYNFNLWLANECMGSATPARHILLRCRDCHRLRTHRSFENRICKCGGMSLSSAIPTDLNTRMAMKALVMER